MTPSPLQPVATATIAAPRSVSAWWVFPACLLCAFAAYLPGVLGAGFVNFDDPLFFGPDNALFTAANEAARQHGVFAGLAVVLDPRHLVADVYLPVAHGSLWLDHWLFDGTPLGPHLVAVALHAMAGFVLWRWLAAMRVGNGVGIAATALFLVHPALCESVAWVSGRKDVFAGLFVFAALWRTAAAAQRPTTANLIAIAGCGVLAMYSKATAVVQPLLALLVCCYLPGDRRRFLAPLVLLLVTLPIAWHHQVLAAAQGTMVGADPLARLPQVPGVFAHYLATAFWPRGLNVLYPEVQTLARLVAALVPAAVAVAVVLLAAVVLWRSRALRTAGFGLFGFLLALLPCNSAFPASVIAVADRYLYLAVPFAALAATVLLAAVLRLPGLRAAVARVRGWAGEDESGRLVPVLGGMMLALPFLIATWQRVPAFASSEALWQASLDQDGDNAVALLNLASAIAARSPGDPAMATTRPLIERAAVAARYPEHARRARLLLAQYALRENRAEAAAQEVEAAIAATEAIGKSGRVNPVSAAALLAQTLLQAIEPYRQLGRTEAAQQMLARAESLAPDDPGVRSAGLLLAVDALAATVRGHGGQAPAADDPAVVAIQTQLAAARRAVGSVDAQIEAAAGMFARLCGRRLEAITCFRRAIDRRPDLVDGWLGAAEVCLDVDCAEAETYARSAIALAQRTGGNVDPRLRLALARAQKGQGHLDEAIRSLEIYTRAQPRDRDAARLYSGLLMHKARGRLADPDVTHAELQDLIDRALAINPQEPAVDLVRARMARDQRHFAAAVTALDRLRLALPELEDTSTMLAENLRDLGYERLFAKDDDGAVTAWLRFLQVAPPELAKDAVQMQLQAAWRRAEEAGIHAREAGDRVAAERAFRACLRIDPQQHWAAWLLVCGSVDDPAADPDELDRWSAQALAGQQQHGLERSRQVAVRATVLGRLGRRAEAAQLLEAYLAAPDADAPAAVLELLRGMQREPRFR